MSRWKLLLGVLALVLTSSTATRTADQTLIAPGSQWRYNDSGTNLQTAWRDAAYSDTNWPLGNAQLGYGDGDESTVISYGSSTNKRITYYFRQKFNVANPSALSALSARYVRDDGAVVYLNGVEVIRSNMPAGAITYTTLAPTAIANADESAWSEAPIDPSLLVTGVNVVAVEIHQQSVTSTDVSFNFELRATENRPAAPSVTLVSPASPGVTNTSAGHVRRLGIGPGRPVQRHLIYRWAAPDDGLYGTCSGTGRTNLRGYSDDAQRRRHLHQYRWPHAACARTDEIPDAHRQCTRTRAGRFRRDVRGIAGELHRLRQPLAAFPPDSGLGRRPGDVERAGDWRGVGFSGRGWRRLERGRRVDRRLHDHRRCGSSTSRDSCRSGATARRTSAWCSSTRVRTASTSTAASRPIRRS